MLHELLKMLRGQLLLQRLLHTGGQRRRTLRTHHNKLTVLQLLTLRCSRRSRRRRR